MGALEVVEASGELGYEEALSLDGCGWGLFPVGGNQSE